MSKKPIPKKDWKDELREIFKEEIDEDGLDFDYFLGLYPTREEWLELQEELKRMDKNLSIYKKIRLGFNDDDEFEQFKRKMLKNKHLLRDYIEDEDIDNFFDYLKRITDEIYDNLLREYKGKQAETLEQMQDHSDADEQFYLTANMTLNIAKRAKEIFTSSEPEEKRLFLGFLLQNCVLNGKTLGFTLRSPFHLMLTNDDNLTVRRR